MFIGRYSYKTRKLEYVNAGHNPPIFYDIEKKKLVFLRDGCVGMGMLDEIPTFKLGTLQIKNKSKLFCYTDGLVELVDDKGVTFGTKQIEQNISNPKDIDDNISTIVKQQKVLEDNASIFDDISIIGIEFYK